jgi:hypothetical protein
MSHSADATKLPRSWFLIGALALATGTLALQLVRSPHVLNLPLYDFAEYWAAGRLVARGDNPYDPAAVGQLERQADRDGEPLMMWNPPWTLPLVLPFGLLPSRVAHLFWLLLSFATVLAAADTLWHEYGGPSAKRGIAWLLVFSFVPTFLTLYLGQIAALLLAGAVLFLRFERRGQDLRAGAATLLLAVKPQLFILFWIALLLWAIDRRRWRVVAGGVLAGLAATLIAIQFDPAVLSQYREALTDRPPAQYRSPTLGTVLRLLWGEERFSLQFLAPLAGLAWFVPLWLRHRRTWVWGERLPGLLFASLLTTPYGAWPFDLIVLLVPLLQVAASIANRGAPDRRALALYVAANAAAAAFVVGRVDFFWWIWLTPALLLAYAAALSSFREGLSSSPLSSLLRERGHLKTLEPLVPGRLP